MNESQQTALAHLAMLLGAAKGEYVPKRKDDLDKRAASLVAFIQSGTCQTGEADRELVAQIGKLVIAQHPEPKAIAV